MTDAHDVFGNLMAYEIFPTNATVSEIEEILQQSWHDMYDRYSEAIIPTNDEFRAWAEQYFNELKSELKSLDL